ncbi:hypothetical protein ABPG74_011992 [Tetrahymena malaccensis]
MEFGVILGCVITTLICLIFVIICSFSSLQVNEYGLDYSSISKTISQTPFEAGVHFLGIGHHFLIFPKTVINIEFSNERGASAGMIMGRTQDGLQVNLEISFQYKLIVKDLYNLYTRFGLKYEQVFVYQSIDILQEMATKYTASDFFTDRFNIGTEMQNKLNEYFQKEFCSSVEFFQLRKVDLPDKFEHSIQETEVQKQSISKAQAQKQKIEVELSTKLMEAEYQATVVKNLAKGDAQSIKYDGESKAKAFQEVQDAYGLQYKHIKDDLQFDNLSLTKYMKSKIIREYEGNQLIVNLDQTDAGSKK